MYPNQPLAERIRPKNLDQFIGQKHLVGKHAVLRTMLEANHLVSMIFWGPPGVGKTTLAKIIATTLDRPFYILSAVSAGLKEVREVIDNAKKQQFFNRPNPTLFIDEIHRFNKAQQDSLLMAVEQGTITLIAATTENPSFEVITTLLSRCQVYILHHLEKADLNDLIQTAIKTDVYLKTREIEVRETDALLQHSGGDARKLLNLIELVIASEPNDKVLITNEIVVERLQKNLAIYDKDGEMHYDIISAFIKSIRGSDPNAAVYWLARMIAGGEEVKFIARRLVILAAEDIGLANPNALLLATNCFQAVNLIGYPESRIILSECAIYLAISPKSNSGYSAIEEALALVEKTGNLSVPLHLRNAPTKLMKELGYGKDYKYAHSYEGNFVDQEFLPKELSGTKFYNPQNNAQEAKLRETLKQVWKEKYGY